MIISFGSFLVGFTNWFLFVIKYCVNSVFKGAIEMPLYVLVILALSVVVCLFFFVVWLHKYL